MRNVKENSSHAWAIENGAKCLLEYSALHLNVCGVMPNDGGMSM